MLKVLIHAGAVLACVGLGLWLPHYFLSSPRPSLTTDQQHSAATTISWRELKSYDYKQQILPPSLKHKLEQAGTIKISGFAVPLEISGTYTNHFLLVPGRAYCIHVPPPPPHLMIEVKMKDAVSVRSIRGPLSIEGILELRNAVTQWGSASWFFQGHSLTAYPTNDPKLLYDHHLSAR